MTVTQEVVETAAGAALHDRPPAPISKSDARSHRPEIVGPDAPEEPFPIILSGAVQRGFGRGGKDLGCPTANLPDDSLPVMSSVTQTGVYYGYAHVSPVKDSETLLGGDDCLVHPMVMSLGWNPFYKNKQLTAEIHVMHNYKRDFYGHKMTAIVLGYIRPELDYVSREALIEDIETDKRVAINCLARPEYQKFRNDPVFIKQPEM